MLNFPFSAALLAGGQSRRMGIDKAKVRIAGEPLWTHQLAILRQLHPTQLFICGRSDVEYSGAGCDVFTDRVPNAGPLGGLITALNYSSTEMVILLAIDMPAMQTAFLEKLLERAHATGRSVVPQGASGLEPLAAVYRIGSLPFAERCLGEGKRSMRSLIEILMEQNLVELYPVQSSEMALFVNVNTPEELETVNSRLSHHLSPDGPDRQI